MASGVAVFLLGGVEARRSSGPIPIPGLKMQALLALLALSAPGPVSDGRLIDELWGDDRLSNPTNSLHSQIAILRRAVGRDAVVRRGLGYALAVEPDDVDASRFVALIERARELAREGDHRTAAQGFQTAINLCRGPPLGDLIDYPFGREAATRFEELLLDAHEGRADAELASGRHADLVVSLTELVRLHPLRERFHAQLIRALYRCGRQADALRAFGAARTTLLEELGLEPGPELRDLELAVLSHDPALAAPAEPPAPPRAAGDESPAGDVTATSMGRASLVGRETELAWLRSDLNDAFAGRGRIALLAGEPGIGKSRLAEELATDATTLGATVAWGRCYGGRGAPAFWPWIQVMQALVAQFPPDVVKAALGRGAADVSQLVPEVHELLPGLGTPASLGPEFERFRLCDALTRSIHGMAAKRPLVIVLEDLHWADASSLEMFSFVAGAILEAPILIVATYRDVGARASESLDETLGNLARQSAVRRIEVSGLDVDAVRTLMATGALESGDELVRTVHRRTQGNPFFLVEILRLRSSSGHASHLEGLPTGVREVIRQRVGLLPDSTVEAMVAASVLGSDFELSTLGATLDIDAASSLQQLEPAFRAGLITMSPDGPGRYRFSHALVRDTLYEELGIAARARLHRRAAEALETIDGVADGPRLFALADHWFHAVPVADPDRAIEHALRAAQWAQRHVAHVQAEEQLRASLVLIDAMPGGQRRSELELEVQYELSMLLVMTTGYASPGVDLACGRMRELCKTVDDRRILVPALWRLSIFSFVSGDLRSAIEIGEQLLDLARDDDPATQLAGHMLLGMIHTHVGNQAVARGHLDIAIAFCNDGHDGMVAGFVAETPGVWVRVFSGMNLALLGEDERAEQTALDAIALAGRVAEGSNVYAVTCATWFASVVATIRGDVEQTRQRCEDGIAMATADGFGMMFVPFMAAHLGWANGRDSDADLGVAQIGSSASAVHGSGAMMWRHVFPALSADACLADDRFSDAIAHTDQGLAALDARGEHWYEAELHRLRGEALAGLDAADPEVAIEFARAIEIADLQGALALRRRAESSVAAAQRS